MITVITQHLIKYASVNKTKVTKECYKGKGEGDCFGINQETYFFPNFLILLYSLISAFCHLGNIEPCKRPEVEQKVGEKSVDSDKLMEARAVRNVRR